MAPGRRRSTLDDALDRSLRSALRHYSRRHKELHMLIVDAQIHLWNALNPTTPYTVRSLRTPRPTRSGRWTPAVSMPRCSRRTRRGIRMRTSWPSRPRGSIRIGRHPRQLSGRQAGEPCARRHVEAAPGDARPALHVPPASAERVADGRHSRLAVAGRRARRPAHRVDGRRVPPEGGGGRPAASELEADPRSPRSAVGRHGESAWTCGRISPRWSRSRDTPTSR